MLLTEAGDRKVEAVRAIRTITGLSLWNSKLLLDSAPIAITEPDWIDVADDAARLLEDAGAKVIVLCDWCDRAITREAIPVDSTLCQGPWPTGTCRGVAQRLRTGYDHSERTHSQI
ncbi:ribosomal protein L7/L12 [Streptomyces sp. NPDC001876]|uniref:ribosomal protein L7/L12 n=1 Tax=Streptomyces sp. NPDC001876 TaxID=3154402 RepID=UPI0033307463